jgi:hypothetical protein
MRWEQLPTIPWLADNTGTFIHDLEPDALATAAGDNTYVRINILTPVGVRDREKKPTVVKEMTEIVAAAVGDPSLAERTWVLTQSSAAEYGAGGVRVNAVAPDPVFTEGAKSTDALARRRFSTAAPTRRDRRDDRLPRVTPSRLHHRRNHRRRRQPHRRLTPPLLTSPQTGKRS